MRLSVAAIRNHPRGQIYETRVDGKTLPILLTFHAISRIARWQLTVRVVLEALVFPEEVLVGHRGRFIAHRRTRRNVVRVVYEYEGNLPVVITVYNPLARRYFRGGGIYEDRIRA